MSTECDNEQVPEGRAIPPLRSLDLSALGVQSAPVEALVCDIDDPDCEAPGTATDRPDAEDAETDAEASLDRG